ncbi:unnamed protein product, partial [Candidula unifasciata]
PEEWKAEFSACGGDKQSPINIFKGDVQLESTLAKQPLRFQNYDTVKGVSMTLENNGHAAVVSLAGKTPVTVTGGGLPSGVFRALQFHFHWGSGSETGSEHLISSRAYPMELHIVHFNTKYKNVSVAIKYPDGLAVLGFMYEVSIYLALSVSFVLLHVP